MARRAYTGGLFPEDKRRTRPVPIEQRAEQMAENGRNGLRACILRLLLRSNFQAFVTDAKTVQTVGGKRQLVYPEGCPDIIASIPITGRAWGIEIKTEDGALRPSQEEMLPQLESAGWLITLARSVEDVNAEIKRQLAMLDPREFENYMVRLRLLRSAAARLRAEREMEQRSRETAKRLK